MTTAERLYAEAMELEPGEREWLAAELVRSLQGNGDVAELSEAWQTEIARRDAELESGAVQTTPWEDVRQKIRATLDRYR